MFSALLNGKETQDGLFSLELVDQLHSE